ncbi:mechanosensitive ion channel [Flavobacteriaceae bacterium R38]|nr:mechanosensitive ion channel [Flavobacteriaceae bacterium R38]
MQKLSRLAYNFFIDQGLEQSTATLLNVIINIVILLIALFLLDRFLRFTVVKTFSTFSNKTKSTFDDFLVKSNFPKYIAHVIPFVLLEALIPTIFLDYPDTESFLLKITDIYLIILIVWLFRSIIKSIRDFLKSKESFKDKPIDSYAQVIIMVAWFFGFLAVFSEITGQSIWSFLATLGAASAILLLVFRDTILGFVASIQVSVNDMVRIGDWITLEKFGADGDVIEINLTTVKVQNFDNTITTIPTYSLISDSFKNWRGMQESNGRRIKRSILIAANSIRFLTEEDLRKLSSINVIESYITHRQKDIDNHNKEQNIDKTTLINGRNQTNMGLFRKYIHSYLSDHPAINKEMMVMVRQLAPTPHGVPLEIYAFSSDKRWENYEYIMADIFDHLLAAISYFELELFEYPKGKDLISLNP